MENEINNEVAKHTLNSIVRTMVEMGIEEIVEVFPDEDGNRYKYKLIVEVVSNDD